jgi:hypothetical protein
MGGKIDILEFFRNLILLEKETGKKFLQIIIKQELT